MWNKEIVLMRRGRKKKQEKKRGNMNRKRDK